MLTRRCLFGLGLCLALTSCSAVAAAGFNDDKGPQCEDVSHLPAGEDRCAFAREYCQKQGLALAYLQLYYCHAAPKGFLTASLLVVFCAALLLLLFRVMARTADDFFACILSQISQDMGLPPRLAGVTLLALGNGAPDLSSCIAAVKTGNYSMALGALTGAGMFVGCVVAGRIVTLNGGAKARWAQIRDVTCYLLAVATVMGIMASGRFSYGSVLGLMLLYGGYVLVVAVADFTKRMGVEWDQVPRQVVRSLSLLSRGGRRPELAAPLLRRERSPSPTALPDRLSDLSSEAGEGQELGSPFFQSPQQHHLGGSGADLDDRNSVEMSVAAQGQFGSPVAAGVAAAGEVVEGEGEAGVAAERELRPMRGRRHSSLPGSVERGQVLAEQPGTAAQLRSRSADRMDLYLQQQAAASQPGGPLRGTRTLPPHLPRPPGVRAVRQQDSGSSSAEGAGRGGWRFADSPPAGGEGGQHHRRHFSLPSWLHLPQLPHLHHERDEAEHVRAEPTVASFQPRVPYDDLVRMPAREYRRRALAEMAQSRSFYLRGPHAGEVLEESEEEEVEVEGVEGERGGRRRSADLEAGAGYTPPTISPEVLGPLSPVQQPSSPPVAATPAQQQQQQQTAGAGLAGSPESPEGEPLLPLHHPPALGTAAAGQAVQEEQSAAEAAPATAGKELVFPASPSTTPSRPAKDAAATAAAAALAEQRRQRQQQQGQLIEEQPGVRFASPPRLGAHEPPLPGPHHHRHTHYDRYEFPSGGGAGPPPAGVLPGTGPVAQEGEGDGGGPEAEGGPAGKLVAIVEAPVMMALQATVPLVEPNAYQRHWFIASMTISPLFIAAYLGHAHWLGLLVAAAVGGGLAAVAVAGTRRLGSSPPFWGFGTHFPIGAALVAVYGFAVAAMWISLFAQEIVALLRFFGVLSAIDGGVLGLTVLAWGNSLMDLINNTSMAGKSAGGNSMAMTACYAGPLFNLVMGLGLGFWSLLREEGVGVVEVSLPAISGVGFVCIMLNCAAVVAAALLNRHWLPQRLGWGMVGWYCVYLAVVLLLSAL